MRIFLCLIFLFVSDLFCQISVSNAKSFKKEIYSLMKECQRVRKHFYAIDANSDIVDQVCNPLNEVDVLNEALILLLETRSDPNLLNKQLLNQKIKEWVEYSKGIVELSIGSVKIGVDYSRNSKELNLSRSLQEFILRYKSELI